MQGSQNSSELRGRWAAAPWYKLVAQSSPVCVAKHSLFVSEVQLVKFYSDRKLVASLSSYTGLDSARPTKVQWLVGIWLQEELQPPFQAFSASDSKAHRMGVSGASDPIRIVAPCLGPYTEH